MRAAALRNRSRTRGREPADEALDVKRIIRSCPRRSRHPGEISHSAGLDSGVRRHDGQDLASLETAMVRLHPPTRD